MRAVMWIAESLKKFKDVKIMTSAKDKSTSSEDGAKLAQAAASADGVPADVSSFLFDA